MSEYEREIYLVPHAQESVAGDGLSVNGERQAEIASEELSARSLGETALILSSNAPRAVATAEIIAVRLKIELVASRIFRTAGELPNSIPNLQHLLEYAADELNEPRIEESDVVLVTHRPLVAAIMGGTAERIEQGKVYEFPLQGWENINYGEREAQLLQLR